MYTPAHIADDDPLMLGTFGKNSLGATYQGQRLGVPTSSTFSTDRLYLTPFFTSRGYSLARWWWQNGATVGTNYIETGIYDENFNLFRASPRTLSAGTVNQLQFVNPGIHGTLKDTGGSQTDAASFASSGSVTLRAGVLYLLSIENSHGSSATAVSSITGDAGLPTFSSRSTTQFNTNLNRISIWSAVPTSDYTGTYTVNFGGTTQTACLFTMSALYHVDTATTDGIVQNAVGTGSSVTPLATLAAFGSANNATFGAFGTGSTTTGTPSTGYIELFDQGASLPVQSQQTVFRPDNDTTVDETITSAAWGACAVEIKSLGTGAVYVPPMRGWLGFHCNGGTATAFRSSSLVYQPYVFVQSSLTTGLPATAIPTTSATTALLVNHGFTRSTSP